MKKIRIIDACFPQGNSGACSEDNNMRKPQHFEWCRENCDSLYTWFTNWTIRNPDVGKYPARVAWLLEPPSIQDWPYRWILKNRNLFDAIFTYDQRLLELGDNRFKFAPHGGSRIDWDLWGIYPKTKDVCMIVSDKKETEGHRLRHKIAEEFGDRIDIYGPSYKNFDRKFNVLRDYRYCVVVESIKMDFYFSEKLIDSISVGCVPIYWGCNSIRDYFLESGQMGFSSIQQLKDLFETIGIDDYEAKKPIFVTNLGNAWNYRMPEDWMYERYEEYFR